MSCCGCCERSRHRLSCRATRWAKRKIVLEGPDAAPVWHLAQLNPPPNRPGPPRLRRPRARGTHRGLPAFTRRDLQARIAKTPFGDDICRLQQPGHLANAKRSACLLSGQWASCLQIGHSCQKLSRPSFLRRKSLLQLHFGPVLDRHETVSRTTDVEVPADLCC